jgi:hypothetical protein
MYTMGLAILVLVADRLLLNSFLGSSAFRRRVMVVGAGDRAQRLRELRDRPEIGIAIVAYIAMSDNNRVVEEAIPRSAIHDLGRFVKNLGVSEVVLALQERRNALPLRDLLRIKTKGAHVNDLTLGKGQARGRGSVLASLIGAGVRHSGLPQRPHGVPSGTASSRSSDCPRA